jgi:hypothetical protein
MSKRPPEMAYDWDTGGFPPAAATEAIRSLRVKLFRKEAMFHKHLAEQLHDECAPVGARIHWVAAQRFTRIADSIERGER